MAGRHAGDRQHPHAGAPRWGRRPRVGGGRTIVEFQVDDVDAEHERLRAARPSPEVAQALTTMPWGNRSVLRRDPDGGLVNLFSPPAAGRHLPTHA